MISYYSGTPGSGKSLHVAMEIYQWIQCGKNVIANFELRDDLIKQFGRRKKGQYVYFPDTQLMDTEKDPTEAFVGFAQNFHKKDKNGCFIESQTLIVFDEGGVLFNSRDWQSKFRHRWLWFFSQHRKFGYDIIMISQSERQIDRQVRANFEYEYNHKRVGNFKLIGKIMEKLLFGKIFCYVIKWYGIKGQDGRVTAQFFRGHPKYYRLYNTSHIFGAGS